MHGSATATPADEARLRGRCIPCDEVCDSTARARAFGAAIGAAPAGAPAGAGGSGKWARSPYTDALVTHARDNPTLADRAERTMRAMLLGTPLPSDGTSGGAASGVTTGDDGLVVGVDLQPMLKAHRAFVHQLAELYGLDSEAFGVEPKRYIRLTRRVGGSSGGSGSAAGSGLRSSIGTEFAPGVLILPALSLAEAVAAASGRPLTTSSGAGGSAAGGSGGGGAGSGGAAAKPAAGGSGKLSAHPSEPHVSAMDRAAIGATLLLHGLRRSTREDTVRTVLAGGSGDEAGVKLRRLDDHNMLATFETAGRAERALEQVTAATEKGEVLPFAARYWGVGVPEVLAGASPATAAPEVPLARHTPAPGAWATVAASRGSAAPHAAATGGGRGGASAGAGAGGRNFNPFAAAFGAGDGAGAARSGTNTVRARREAADAAAADGGEAW